MAKEWWDPAGGMKALHAMNDLRIPFIKNGLVNSHRLKALEVKNKVKFLEGVKILDVGCGGGILSEALARLGGSVTGIDPSDSLVGVARSHSKSLQNAEPPTYVVSTVEQHAHQAMATYDVVVASEVIEHVTDKESFLAACIASLKLGGSLFITTPNRTIASWLGGIIMAENLLNMVPKGTHSYSKFIKPSELSVLCEKYGCSIQLINGMFYDPVRNKWMWSPTKTFIYSLHAIKIKDLFR
ncbi:ubiquinone biosynthesis O-methyltransferase, mitochondrial-like isoform X2 [Macrosteles quadrilineatus]|nr:ubiquinone biosynthesis O-methyltransferase, mitochondrial-like isoform X2 [Macrosteles quadrilineatus]